MMSVGVTITRVVNFTAGDEDSMRLVLGLHQPISVAFQVPAHPLMIRIRRGVPRVY